MIGVRVFQQGDLRLDELAAVARNRSGILKVLGAEGVRQFKRNFRDLGQRPNRLNAPSTGFWQAAAASTSFAVDAAAPDVTISVSHRGVRLQHEGGTVFPVHADALAIPIHPDAHGKRPGDIPGLFPVVSAENAGLARPGPLGSKVAEWMFVFKASVTIRPHPEVLPPRKTFNDAIVERGARWLDRNTGTRP